MCRNNFVNLFTIGCNKNANNWSALLVQLVVSDNRRSFPLV
jgi:hypothetical protein